MTDGTTTEQLWVRVRAPYTINQRVRGRGHASPPYQCPFRAHPQSARAAHAGQYLSPSLGRASAVACLQPLFRSTPRGGYAGAERQSAIVGTASATGAGVARRCGGTLAARGRVTRSRHDRRLRSASGNSRRVEGCHRAGRCRFLLRAPSPSPTRVVYVLFLAPTPGRGPGRVPAAHSC